MTCLRLAATGIKARDGPCDKVVKGASDRDEFHLGAVFAGGVHFETSKSTGASSNSTDGKFFE